MSKRQNGFTLIELVVVITIIGILAAIALPKFAAIQGEARIAKMNAALGSMKSAAAMAHAQLLVSGFSATYTNAASPFSIEGVAVIYTNGYPTAGTIAQLAGVAAPDYLASVAASVATITPDANHATCDVTYTEAAAGNTPVFGNTDLSTVANCQ